MKYLLNNVINFFIPKIINAKDLELELDRWSNYIHKSYYITIRKSSAIHNIVIELYGYTFEFPEKEISISWFTSFNNKLIIIYSLSELNIELNKKTFNSFQETFLHIVEYLENYMQ